MAVLKQKKTANETKTPKEARLFRRASFGGYAIMIVKVLLRYWQVPLTQAMPPGQGMAGVHATTVPSHCR